MAFDAFLYLNIYPQQVYIFSAFFSVLFIKHAFFLKCEVIIKSVFNLTFYNNLLMRNHTLIGIGQKRPVERPKLAVDPMHMLKLIIHIYYKYNNPKWCEKIAELGIEPKFTA